MNATAVVKETTPKYQPIVNADATTAMKAVFGALEKWEDAKRVVGEAQKAYKASLVYLPSIYLASNRHDPKNGCDIKGLLALADLPETREASMSYYLRGGAVMARLSNDGKTSPATIMTKVNYASQQGRGIKISQIDDIIEELAKKEGSTWADFCEAVDATVVDKSADNAITVLEKQESLNAGQIARIERLLAKHAKK